jgi:hypothetical protein
MADNKPSPSDQELLTRIGLSHDDLRDMQKKFARFAASLNPAQKKSLEASAPKVDKAAKTLGDDVTPERLQTFIKSHSDPANSLVLFNEGGGSGP